MVYTFMNLLFIVDKTIQLRAIEWLHQFLELAGRQMLAFCPGIVTCILRAQSYDDGRKEIIDKAKQVNSQLMLLITTDDDKPR